MSVPLFDGNLLLGRCPFRRLPEDDRPANLRHAVGAVLGIGTSFAALFYKDWHDGFLRDYEASASDLDLFHHVPVNPTLGGWRRDLEKALSLPRTVSIKLAPFLHHYSLDAPFITKILDVAEEKNLPLVVMRRLSDDRLVPRWLTTATPDIFEISRFIDRHQERVPIVLSHFLPMELETILHQVHQAPFCELGTFTPSEGGYARIVKASSRDRLLFGSGAPFFYHGGGWLGLADSELSTETKQAIFHETARQLYRIEAR